MKVLGIETSCDETAVAVLEEGEKIIVNFVSSQIDVHKKFGGVVPEIASRHHVSNIKYLLKQAFDVVKPNDIDLVAVTYGPGLVGALLVGISVAKGIAMSRNIPLVAVNHLLGHIHSIFFSKKVEFPFVALLASGGHTEIVYVENETTVKVLGKTVDDAAGEAFDKVARVLNLGYPGGPAIQKAAENGNPHIYKFPRPLLNSKDYNFSFAGLKTSVLYFVRDHPKANISDIAASFQEAIVDVLVKKVFKAARDHNIRNVVFVGGVSANKRLREKAKEYAEKWNYSIFFPELSLCTDNAAMIARAGYFLYKKGYTSDIELNAVPNLSLDKG
ncbi:MAG: tRNA (adenosine(37)-N6)-threonylcarbamoyltransferase complex transferase subunit TsaD [Thermotogaceae bacterium]|nr:tRNA (adenosine(37)-N6)-threonylcarbamoyltransferase complex transferase subunit TsaD [Thermotogaceae bacterium]